MNNLIRRLARNARVLRVARGGCPACGGLAVLVGGPVIWESLRSEWNLTKRWVDAFDEREGVKCVWCRCSLRSQQLSRALLGVSPELGLRRYLSVSGLVRDIGWSDLKVAEINSAGHLHRFLGNLPNLSYSEFGSMDPDVASEDLMELSYEDGVFDLVITSETLEHVPDVERAMKEIRRVLKPGGFHVFTVPVVLDGRLTRKRAGFENGELVHYHPPSYHGCVGYGSNDLLVFYEFGDDFLALCESCGFDVRLESSPRNPALTAFCARAK